MVASRSRQGFLTMPSQARKLQLYNKKTGMVTPSFNYIFFDALELSLKKNPYNFLFGGIAISSPTFFIMKCVT